MMKISRRAVHTTVFSLAAAFLVLAQCPGFAAADSVQVISASPGQTVTYSGHGSPGSQASMEVTATISVGVDGSRHYRSTMSGVSIPGGSRFSITASPVETFGVTGSLGGLSMTIGSVNDHVGSASMGNVPGGTYNIVVAGISNGSSVSMTVHAYRQQEIGGDGAFTVSLSTSGLPPAVYSVRQGGVEVAKVYLGVAAPPTPTPTATPVASATANSSANATAAATVAPANATVTPTAAATVATPSAAATPTSVIQAAPTASPGADLTYEPLWMTLAMLASGVVAGLIIGYVVVFVILRK